MCQRADKRGGLGGGAHQPPEAPAGGEKNFERWSKFHGLDEAAFIAQLGLFGQASSLTRPALAGNLLPRCAFSLRSAKPPVCMTQAHCVFAHLGASAPRCSSHGRAPFISPPDSFHLCPPCRKVRSYTFLCSPYPS